MRGDGGFGRGHEKADGRKALGPERGDQRIHRGGIGGGEVAAVEGDGDGGAGVLGGGAGCRVGGGIADGLGARDDALVRVVPAAFGDGFVALDGGCVKPCRKGQLRQCGLGRDGPPRLTEGREAAQGRDRQGRERIQPRIGATVCGQDGQRYAAPPGKILHLRQPIGPVAFAADQPDQDRLCPRERLVNISIDRQRVTQGHEIGQPRAGQRSCRPRPARRESPQIAVGKGQHHQIGGGLPDIERRVRFL